MKTEQQTPRSVLLGDHLGIYIPQHFIQSFTGWKGIETTDADILNAGPDHEHYWEAWDNVLETAYFIDIEGNEWSLEQDGALFVVPSDPDEWNAAIFNKYFEESEEWILEYVQSDDYGNDYAYLVGEGDRINHSVPELLTKCSNFWNGPCLSYRAAKLISADVVRHILDHDAFDPQVNDEYSSEPYGWIDGFPIGEHEDPIDVSSMQESIGEQIYHEGDFLSFCDALDTYLASQNDHCLRGWTGRALRNQKYATIYQYVNTGLRIDYVVDDEVLCDITTQCIVEFCRKGGAA